MRINRYKISEIFKSVQCEGLFSGMPSIFIRFYGCNLTCPFCDEKKKGFRTFLLDEILDKVKKLNCKNIILTGGEPTLQINTELLKKLKYAGYRIAIETNGEKRIPKAFQFYIDWITFSPKTDFFKLDRCDEVKIVYNGQSVSDILFILNGLKYNFIFLQPESNKKQYLEQALQVAQDIPGVRISVQWHKFFNIK